MRVIAMRHRLRPPREVVCAQFLCAGVYVDMVWYKSNAQQQPWFQQYSSLYLPTFDTSRRVFALFQEGQYACFTVVPVLLCYVRHLCWCALFEAGPGLCNMISYQVGFGYEMKKQLTAHLGRVLHAWSLVFHFRTNWHHDKKNHNCCNNSFVSHRELDQF